MTEQFILRNLYFGLMKKIQWTLLLFLAGFQLSIGQADANYWTNNYGTKGQLLNGSVIAGVDDNSAIYYNPSAIGEDSTGGVSFSLFSPTYSFVNTNSEQLNNQIITDLSLLPNILVIEFNPLKTDRITTAFTLFKKREVEAELKGQYTQELEDGRFFTGNVHYDNNINETWGGLGMSYQVNPKFKIGVTQFLAFNNHRQLIDVEGILTKSATDSEVLHYLRRFRQFKYSVNGSLLTKFGLLYQLPKFKFGLTLTTPKFINILQTGNYQFSNIQKKASGNLEQHTKTQNTPDEISFHAPWSVAAGFTLSLSPHQKVLFTTEYFLEIPKYAIIDEGGEFKVTDASKDVINYAIGYQDRISKSFTLLAGFKVDNSNKKNVSNSATNEFSLIKFDWNIYSISLGGHFNIRSFRFSAGVDYSFSNRTSNALLNPFDNVAEQMDVSIVSNPEGGKYTAISIFFNYALIFDRINKE